MNRDKIIEIEKIRASTDKFFKVCDIVKHFISIIGIISCFYVIFKGVEPFLSSNPKAIEAIAKIIESINFSNITGYLIGGLGYGGWLYERKGKKRAIELKGEYQKQAEKDDAYRSSSGLTETGDTPKGVTR